MEVLIEEILGYGLVVIIIAITVIIYLRKNKKDSKKTQEKVDIAKEEGLFEPVSLHPFINLDTCIGSGACISDCPEKDILGIVDGKATVIQASNCVGHGACFHACPVEAISLRIGTETRGVDLPHVNQSFETNMKGVYIAGELGGMGLIKNSVEQGEQAVENIYKNKKEAKEGVLDLVIVGAGPAGISASLNSKKLGLKSVTLEQDTLGGTVYTYPRNKLVMTAPMHLPLYGKVKLYDTNKDELLDLWNKVITENDLEIHEKTKVEEIIPQKDETFKVITNTGNTYIANHVLLAIGRRGSPRKLSIPGEMMSKVAYRLLEPERIKDQRILVVGGGDSAIEAALQLKDQNKVSLSYRKDKFARLKPRNRESILDADKDGSVELILNSNVKAIDEKVVSVEVEGERRSLENDLVYIFIGGELPTNFLQKAGVEITKRFAYIVKKHD
ncbi:MAG: NAD(P)-binding domain-containing protein [Flavobacteriales bacterium]|nr:NAD(P)-binding domain-containing protein [Flavobacteriales bacterium]